MNLYLIEVEYEKFQDIPRETWIKICDALKAADVDPVKDLISTKHLTENWSSVFQAEYIRNESVPNGITILDLSMFTTVYPEIIEYAESKMKNLKNGGFLNNYFEFIADPEGLSHEEVIQDLKDEGIDTDQTKLKIEQIFKKGMEERLSEFS